MITQVAVRRLVVQSLLDTAVLLQVRGGPVAEHWCRDCWQTIAELEQGCDCLESASSFVTSARTWLSAA